nr:hypothetical protein [Spirochaeta sp.]
MKRDVLETIHTLITDEHRGGVATVIAVRGSASARVGSKAVFDATGKNLAGWVGGGCAETYVGENVVAALEDRAPRIVHVDLDDEIFGLGIVCGGTMDVFVEPLLPPRQLSLPRLDPMEYETELRFLAESLGFKAAFDGATKTVNGLADLYLVLAGAIAVSRGQQMVSLRRVKQLPVHFVEGPRRRPDSVLLVGQTRITETLARLVTPRGVPSK